MQQFFKQFYSPFSVLLCTKGGEIPSRDIVAPATGIFCLLYTLHILLSIFCYGKQVFYFFDFWRLSWQKMCKCVVFNITN